VTIIAFKPFAMPKFNLNAEQLARLNAQQKEAIGNAQNTGTLVVQFADGTKADTGVLMPSLLANYLEVEGTVTTPDGSTSASAAQSANTHPQPTDALSDEEVTMGLAGKGRGNWVLIQDMGLMAAQGNQVPSISLYMPEAVLWIQAESAKKQFMNYEPSQEEKRRALMVVAHGYAGKTITEGCTSITRVVLLSDLSGKVVKEACLSEPLEEMWRNNFGATNDCQALRAKFSLRDVHEVKAAAPNGEFLVAVFSGGRNTKTYKIKNKHQSKLGLD
jgi:hypothetical protein